MDDSEKNGLRGQRRASRVTRAEMIGLAGTTGLAGIAGLGALAALGNAGTALAETYDEAADGQLDELDSDGWVSDDWDSTAYDGVGEGLSYYGSGNGIAPYATPQVTYADERLSAPKRVLVVVDYQVDFVDGGVFGTIEPAVAIEDALCEKIFFFNDTATTEIYTMDTHPADSYDLTREATVNPPHCDPATEGWQLYGKVRDLLNPDVAILVKKGTYGSRDLPAVIQGIIDQGTAIESIEFAGVSTTCRVLHNAIILYNFFPELPMIMDAATTASYTDERTEEQLEELEAWGFVVRR